MTAHPKLNTQQVRDAGQYFVAAEISRRGGYAVVTPGNRKRIDILANDARHERFIGVQVKTKNHAGPRWPVQPDSGHSRNEPVGETNFWVLVDLADAEPKYYVVPAWWIENHIHMDVQTYLAKHGQRPQRRNIDVADVEQWKDRWDILRIFPMSDELKMG
jgi:hypothetical protein